MQNQEKTPGWQKFLNADDQRLKHEQRAAKNLVPLKYAKDVAMGPNLSQAETQNLAPSKYNQMYEAFSTLPSDYQEQIIAEIRTKRNQGEDPRELIARSVELVKALGDFTRLDSEPKKPGTQKEPWRKELDEILIDLEKHRSKPGAQKPKKKEGPAVAEKWVQ